MSLYDTIGQGYGGLRKQDPRIAAPILRALGDSRSVVNVGAGAGSYEPHDLEVLAVEPSAVMIQQRADDAAPVVRASATQLPFCDDSFDASLAILTIHHWSDVGRGLRELRRVSRGPVVILTFDTSVGGFWLTDYFPEILEIDGRTMPKPSTLREHLGELESISLPIPHDCIDGFLGAYWQRPQAYLDARIRSAISVFSMMSEVEQGVAELRDDLESGEWQQKYGELLDQPELDLGYRLVVA